MNRKAQISGETVGIVVVVILIAVGAMIWMAANNSGPFYWLKTLMPNFDKPAVTEIALTGLIKYDFAANNLQYYDGVKFQNFEVKNGEQVLVIGDKAFRYNNVNDAFNSYYFSRTGNKFSVSGNDATNIISYFGFRGSTDVDLAFVLKGGSGGSFGGQGEKPLTGDLVISLSTKPIVMQEGVPGDSLSLGIIILGSDNVLYDKSRTNRIDIFQNSQFKSVYDSAVKWRDSVLSKPIPLNVYDYKNGVISASCKSYSFPVSKVKALQGNGFVLTADLAKGTGSGACSGNVA